MVGASALTAWLVWWAAAGAATADAAAPATCKRLDLPALLAHMRASPQKDVVFFATWCASCAQHLRPNAKPAILVATFDAPEAVVYALRRMQVRQPCLLDGGAAKALGVRSVPSRFALRDGRLQRL